MPPSSARGPTSGVDPRAVPALVMRSVENARVAIDDGKLDTAIKAMKSTDALCSRVVAPPTVHGLCLRVLADAYVSKKAAEGAGGLAGGAMTEGDGSGGGEAQSSGEGDDGVNEDYAELAKEALKRGIDMCKVHEGKAGMNAYMRHDLLGRLGDLYAALGEIYREEGNHKEAIRALRHGLARFEKNNQNDFTAATYNRVAYCYMEQSVWDAALDTLQSAERAATGNDAESILLSTTHAYRAQCYRALDQIQPAREAFEKALTFAMACGNEPVVREAEEFLAETQAHSAVDDSAFL